MIHTCVQLIDKAFHDISLTVIVIDGPPSIKQ